MTMAPVAVPPPLTRLCNVSAVPLGGGQHLCCCAQVIITRRMPSARPRRSATAMVADHNDHEQGSALSGADQQGAGGLIRTEDAADSEEDEEKLLPWQACVYPSPLIASTVELARWGKRVGWPMGCTLDYAAGNPADHSRYGRWSKRHALHSANSAMLPHGPLGR